MAANRKMSIADRNKITLILYLEIPERVMQFVEMARKYGPYIEEFLRDQRRN